ncbi:hypothetical protein [Tissierella sp. Yu-01]|uniref:hypothetical protein n=1 Tax=Tissierella sp. Yu-01 TaxID=3035694 RepID=UPI00240D8C51|nr:hypothetical protein [Tissierella sp. Yu-01]WFA10333.1 hypothetical protein P3962_07215 [Tissierella sp. Yu-01]
MYDIKPKVNELLEGIVGEDNVSDSYPNNFNNLPYISFYEQDNKDVYKIKEELYTEVVIQIDIWHNRSTGTLARQVNDVMKSIGFKRDFARDIPDPVIKHKTMRFKARINNRTKIMYQ